MKLIVAGSRTFSDYPLLRNELDRFVGNEKDVVILCGDARGADSLGARYAEERGFAVEHFPALWKLYGRLAGFLRNRQMADAATHCIVFWDGVSHGTRNMIYEMANRDKPVKIVRFR